MTKRIDARANVHRLVSPKTIALVGASLRPEAAASVVHENLRRIESPARVYLVNPRYDSIGDATCYSSLSALPEVVDSVFIGVGGHHVYGVVQEAASMGVPSAVINASNVSHQDLDQLKLTIQESGMSLCGPNTVGLLNLRERVGLWTVENCPVSAGPVAVIAHSGTVAMTLTEGVRKVGFDYVMCCGNEAGLSAADYLDYLAEDDHVRVVIMFLESIRDPELFESAARRAKDAGKSMIALKVGASDVGAAMVSTHTGALAGDSKIYDAFLRSVGVLTVSDLDQLLESAILFSAEKGSHAIRGRPAMVTLSGGLAALAADVSAELGLSLAPLAAGTIRGIREAAPSLVNVSNPLDAWGAGWDESAVAGALDVLAIDPSVSSVVALLDAPEGGSGEVEMAQVFGRHFAALKASGNDRAFVVVNVNGQGPPARAVLEDLEDGGVVCLSGLRESLMALTNWSSKDQPTYEVTAVNRLDVSSVSSATATAREWEQLLERAGVRMVRRFAVLSAEQAIEAAEQLGYPVVVKGWHPRLLHKTEHGLVRQSIWSAEELARIFDEVLAITKVAGPFAPAGVPIGVYVEPHINHDLELIVGVQNTAAFGSYCLVGLGGVHAEALGMTTLARGPLTTDGALELMLRTPIGRIFDSPRGKRYDALAVAAQVAAISVVGAALSSDIASLEVNPLAPLADDLGVVALDLAVEYR